MCIRDRINVIQYHKLNIFVVAILRILVEVAKKNRRNQGARPVSYTHLDVYKRQVKRSS